MVKNLLFILLPLFFFGLLDFFIFLLNRHFDHAESNLQNSERLKYYPNLNIWGMGFIAGLTAFIFNYFEPLKNALLDKKDILLDKSEIVLGNDMKILDCRVTSMELIQQIAIMLFFLAVLGSILAAIVKIVKDE